MSDIAHAVVTGIDWQCNCSIVVNFCCACGATVNTDLYLDDEYIDYIKCCKCNKVWKFSPYIYPTEVDKIPDERLQVPKDRCNNVTYIK